MKKGKPLSFYVVTEHLCPYSVRDLQYSFWECTKPGKEDADGEYTEPCTEQDWIACPLNPKRHFQKEMEIPPAEKKSEPKPSNPQQTKLNMIQQG